MIPITQEIVFDLMEFNPDTGIFLWKTRDRKYFVSDRGWNSWNAKFPGTVAGSTDSAGHRQVRMLGGSYALHRVAWLYVYGDWPPDQIDHINGIRDDNRICNLRAVDGIGNARNQKLKPSNKTGVIGVSLIPSTGKYRARIRGDAGEIHLGVFKTIDDAAIARKRAENHFGYHPNHGRAR